MVFEFIMSLVFIRSLVFMRCLVLGGFWCYEEFHDKFGI